MIHGTQHPLAILTERKVRSMRLERQKKGTSYAKLGAKHGVSAQTANCICRGTKWPHVGGPIETGPSKRGRRPGSKQRTRA